MSSDAALTIAEKLIRKYESCSLVPYRDLAGNWTIGWGMRFLGNGQLVTANTLPLTRDQADAWMYARLYNTATQVDKLVSDHELNDNQHGVLYDLAWNIGVAALQESTLVRCLKAGNILAAADQFLPWVYAGGRVIRGLEIRRAEERDLFLKDVTLTNGELA